MAFAKELLYSGPKLEDELKKAQAQRPIVENTEAVEAKTGEIGKSIAAENSPKEKSAVDQLWERGSQAKQDVMSAAAKAKVKVNAAKKELEDYLSSDEYKQRTAEREKKLIQDRAIKQLMTGIVDMQEPQIVKDEKEDQLRAAADLAQRDAKDAQDLEDLNVYVNGLTADPARMTKDQGVMATDLKEFASMPHEDRRALEMYVAQRDADYYDTLNFAQNGMKIGRAEQQAAGLFEKYGKQRIDELAETFARYRNEKTSQEVAKAAQKQGSGGFWEGTGASVAAVPAAALSGVGGVMGYAKEAGNRTGRYSTMDPNNEGNFLGTYSGNVKSAVAQNIEEGHGTLGKVGSIAYQAAMSTAESIARAYLGGGAAGGAGLAATATFSQTMADAAKQGATPGQAALLATADAAIEYLTEKIPLDEMISVAKGSDVKALLANTMRQAGIEATTEELSLVGSLIAEAAILKDKSAYNLEVKGLMGQGLTEEEAKNQANQGIWQEAVNTALVSGLSGGFSGAASTLKGAYSSDQDAKAKADAEQTAQQPQAAPETAQTEQGQQTTPQVEQTAQNGPMEALAKGMQELGRKTAEVDAQKAVAADGKANELQPANDAIRKALGMNGATDTEYSERMELAQKADSDRKLEKQREKTTYEELLSAKREQKNLEKEIEKAEKKLSETGKGSPARIEQLKAELERQKNLVSQMESQYSYFSGDYETNIEAAIDQQNEIFEKAKERAAQAISDHEAGIITDAQLKDAKDAYNNAGAELHKLKNMTQEQYREELGSVGLAADYGTEIADERAAYNQTSRKRVYAAMREGANQTGIPGPGKRNTNRYGKTLGQKHVNEAGSTPAGESPKNGSLATPIDSASINSIPRNGVGVNGNSVNPELGIKGTGAAEQNFTGKADYQSLLTDENTQRDRPGDVRPMEVPKKNAAGEKVSEFVSNSYGAEVTPDQMADRIERMIQDGKLTVDSRTNKESLESARKYIYGTGDAGGKGEAAVQKEISDNIGKRKIQDGDIEKAAVLYAKYANGTDKTSQNNAAEMMVDLQAMATMSGRNLQLFKLIRMMTPEGQLMAVQKGVQRNVENMVKSGQVKKGYEASLDPELMQDYLDAAKESKNATDPKKQKEAEQRMKDTEKAIYVAEAAKMPATFKAKWDAWRYMSMLGNVKTQVRNIAGNAMFMPYKAVKDKMGALMEKALPKEQRTKSLTTDRDLLDWAKADAKTESVQDALKYSAKLGDDVSAQKLSDGRKVFDSKVLETMRQWTQKVPEAGDMIFKNPYYAKSLAGFLRARGYSAGDIQSGTVSDTVLDEGRAYAINEAMKATFNDSNAFSDFMANELRYKGDNPIGKVANALVEGVLPFRRTPANIVVRFTEYSPVGVMRGLVNMGKSIANGKVTASDAIDQIAAGLTGSAAMALGAYLASGTAGIKLTGSGTEDDEKRQGHQDYAIEFTIGGQEYSYKIDWAAPANMPLFVGANIYAMLQNTGEDTDVSKFTAFLRGMGTMLEPMLSLSCMSSLNDILESVSYADDGEKLYSLAASAATSYFTQGIPALARQSAQALQEYKQSTFANSDDPTIRDAQKTAANIPFLGSSHQTDKVNAWGEKEKNSAGTDDLLERATGAEADDRISRVVDAFVNPGTLKKIDNSTLEQEITRLNSVQENSVTPPYAAKTISYTDSSGEKHLDQRLTEEQYQTLSTTQGETAKRIVTEMIASKDYAAMTDEQKALAIRQAYTYARETGEIAAMDDHYGYSESWMKQMKEGKEASEILRRVASSELSKAVSALDDAWDNNWDSAQDSEALRTAYDSYKSMTLAAKREVRETATGTTAKYIEAREKGISHEDFLAAAENVATVKGTGSNGTVRDIDRREAIAKTAGLSQKEIDIIMKCYMPDYDPNAETVQKTELKYDYARQELGLTPAQYVETYRASLDNSKKAEKIAAIMDLGYDRQMATALYKLYQGQTDVVAWYEGK